MLHGGFNPIVNGTSLSQTFSGGGSVPTTSAFLFSLTQLKYQKHTGVFVFTYKKKKEYLLEWRKKRYVHISTCKFVENPNKLRTVNL